MVPENWHICVNKSVTNLLTINLKRQTAIYFKGKALVSEVMQNSATPLP